MDPATLSTLTDIVKTLGVPTVLIRFFVWDGSRREQRMGTRGRIVDPRPMRVQVPGGQNSDGATKWKDGGTATFNSFEFGFASTPPGAGLTLGTLTSTTFNSAIVVGTATTADALYSIPFGLTCNVAGTLIPRVAENIAAGGTATVELNSFLWAEDSQT